MSISHCKKYTNDGAECVACLDQLKPAANRLVCECVAGSGIDCGAGRVCTDSGVCVAVDSCLEIPMCVQCDKLDQTKCIRCYGGFFLSSNSNKCISLAPCASSTHCQRCSEVSGQESKCVQCSGQLTVLDGKCDCDGEECDQYDSTYNFKWSCTKDADPAADKRICVQNDICKNNWQESYVLNCGACDPADQRKCIACEPYYIFDADGACVSMTTCRGINYCTECDSADETKCAKCSNQMHVTNNGKRCTCAGTEQCGFPSVCSATANQCLNKNACFSEGKFQIPLCTACDAQDPAKCTACSSGYEPATDQLSCVRTTCQNIAECTECAVDDIKRCSKCVGNLTPTADGDACECASGSRETCPENAFCSSEHICVQIGACARIPYCVQCRDYDQNKCSKCINTDGANYFVSADGTKCLERQCRDINFCDTCKEDDLSKCATCYKSNVVNEALNVCECAFGSKTVCGGMSSCSNGQCVPYNACKDSASVHYIKNCSRCADNDQTQCKSCQTGYYLDANGTACLSVSTCSAISYCIACDATNPRRCAKCGWGLSPEAFGMACECDTGTRENCDQSSQKCSKYARKCVNWKACITAIQNCSVCVSEAPYQCEKCVAGYLPNFSKTLCVPENACLKSETLVPGCTQCQSQDQQKCLTCDKGMTPEPFGYKCVCGNTNTTCVGDETCVQYGDEKRCIAVAKCDSTVNDCFTCDAVNNRICTHCNPGFQQDADSGKCVLFTCSVEHCTTCNAEKCAACEDRLQPSGDGLKCVCGATDSACSLGEQCSLAGACEKINACMESDLQCMYCELGRQTQCARCFDGFDLIDNKCRKTGPCTAIEHCVECDARDISKCAECRNGLTVNASGTACACGLSGNVCTSDEICVDGTCFGKNECLEDDSHCIQCDSANPTRCGKCEWGYISGTSGVCEIGGNCTSIAQCKKCDANDAKLCHQCAGNLSVTENQLACECVPGSMTGCQQSEICTSQHVCVEKFACQSIHFCVECVRLNQSLCYACADGYYLNKDKTECLSLSTCAHVENCSKCNPDHPEECQGCANYLTYNAETGKCECVTDSGVGCADGFVCANKACVSATECLKADSNCETCVPREPAKCAVCKGGFYPGIDGFCISNAPCARIQHCEVCQLADPRRCYGCANQLTPGPLALSCECVPGSRTGCAVGFVCAKDDGVCVQIDECLGGAGKIENCRKCAENDNRSCSECSNGFLLSVDGMRCIPADSCLKQAKIKHCKGCNAVFPDKCAECVQDAVLGEFGLSCKCEGPACVDDKRGNELPVPAIVGISIGAIALVSAILLIVVFVLVRRKRAGSKKVAVQDACSAGSAKKTDRLMPIIVSFTSLDSQLEEADHSAQKAIL